MRIGYLVDTETGCHLCFSHSLNKDGYATVKVKSKTVRLHRYIYELKKGMIPKGYVIRHTCDNPMCVNPLHLITGSHSDNVKDRVERGRSAVGERNGRSKLTEREVVCIVNSRLSVSELAKEYRVDPKTIRNIKEGKTWKTVSKKINCIGKVEERLPTGTDL